MKYREVEKIVTGLGLKWYSEANVLNIIAVRENYTDTNKFKDKIYICFIKSDGEEVCDESKITTLPGWYWLKNPMNKKGCGILKPGQYIDVYKIGKHYQQDALVQVGKFIVWRDNNKDTILDLENEESGIQMANLHHADGVSEDVERWSALCQVYFSTTEHNTLMANARRQVQLNGKETFTYTLIMRKDFK